MDKIKTSKTLKCSLCDYICSRNGNLQVHYKIHSGDKPYKCDICDFRCSIKRNLQRHQRKHSNDNLQTN